MRKRKRITYLLEEIDEKTYKDKVEKSNGTPIKQKKVSLEDCTE